MWFKTPDRCAISEQTQNADGGLTFPKANLEPIYILKIISIVRLAGPSFPADGMTCKWYWHPCDTQLVKNVPDWRRWEVVQELG
jgi:hypothetical protein